MARSRPSGACCKRRCLIASDFTTSWKVEAEAALARFDRYYNYHRLSGTRGWITPAERYNGNPFLDRGFEHIPALAHLQPWLDTFTKVA